MTYPPALATAGRSLLAVTSRPLAVLPATAMFMAARHLLHGVAQPDSALMQPLLAGAPWTVPALQAGFGAFLLGLGCWLTLGLGLVLTSPPQNTPSTTVVPHEALASRRILEPRRAVLLLLVGLLMNFGIAAPQATVWAIVVLLTAPNTEALVPGASIAALFVVGWTALLVISLSLSAGLVALAVGARTALGGSLPTLALRVFGQALSMLMGSRLWPSLALGFATLAVSLPLTLLIYAAASAGIVATGAGATALALVQSLLGVTVMLVAATTLRDGLTESPRTVDNGDRTPPDRSPASADDPLPQPPGTPRLEPGTGSAS